MAVGILLTLLIHAGCRSGLSPTNSAALCEYRELLHSRAFDGEALLYRGNLTGRIVWNEQYFMESLLNVFEITGDVGYLRTFVTHADHVLGARDDYCGRTDFAGRSRPGWQIAAHYTLGVPLVIPSASGSPSLLVQGIHRAGNDHTSVQVIDETGSQFTLIVTNDFRTETCQKKVFNGLTVSNIEERINGSVSPQDYIRVTMLGEKPPSPGYYALNNTYKVVLHELNTPLICVPLLRFVALVQDNPVLAQRYGPKAATYLQACEQSYGDFLDSWRQDREGLYLVFEPDSQYWASGLPVPYNGLAAMGRFCLWLHKTTGKREYLKRAELLAHRLYAGFEFLSDGTVTMPYWYGLPYRGWSDRINDPINGIYIECHPFDATEDLGHFCLTLLFVSDAYERGVVFRDRVIRTIAKTFLARLHSRGMEDSSTAMAHNLNGEWHGHDYTAAFFALLSEVDPNVLPEAERIYRARCSSNAKVDLDYELGYVLLGWSIIAKAQYKAANRT